jgi:hypothetical protein
VQLVAETEHVEHRKLQAVHLLVLVAQKVPAAHEQKPVESIVVN